MVKDKETVRNVVVFLSGCNIPALYHHSGHLGDQGRLAQVLNGYLTASKPVILSQETYCNTSFICTADRLLVADFPNSIDSYRDCKTLIDFSTQKGLITTLVSEMEDHLLPELKDYIIQKGEPFPPWLAPAPPRMEYPPVYISMEDNLPQGNKSLPSFSRKSHKPHWRKPPKPPFIGPNILDCPLEPDPKKTWTQVSISTTYAQSNSGVDRPSQVRVRREITYKYGPVDIQMNPDNHKYDALLSRHLLAIRERSGFQSSSNTQHNLDDRSGSYANGCPPLPNSSKSLDQGSNPVSVQPRLSMVPTEVPNPIPKSWSSIQLQYGSIPSPSMGSQDDLVPSKSNVPQNPMLPRSKAIVPQ